MDKAASRIRLPKRSPFEWQMESFLEANGVLLKRTPEIAEVQ